MLILKTRNFFIKKHYRETERHYWLGEENFDPIDLTTEKVTTEFIALAIYRLMGITTPKTYAGRNLSGSAVLISKRMAHWQPIQGVIENENGQLNALSRDYAGLAHLELASALLSDLDVSGWNLDNLGLKNGTQITKLDGGAAVVNKDRKQYYLQFFSQSPESEHFREGVCTLSDDCSLNTTYLKIFREKNISNYHLHYFDLFKNIQPADRKTALLTLFKIKRSDLEIIMHKIPEEWCSETNKTNCIAYLMERIELFKQKYGHHFLPEALNPKTENDYPHTFVKLHAQKYFEKKDWEQKYIKDESYSNESDFSQSRPNQYVKR